MSTTILAVIVNMLAILLPLFGVEVGTERLTEVAQTVVAISTGLWIWYQRVKRGDVNAAGLPRA